MTSSHTAIIAVNDLAYGKKVQETLKRLGFESLVINEGIVALRKLVYDKDGKIKTVIVDEEMPKISGVDLVRWVKLLCSETNAILLTSNPQSNKSYTVLGIEVVLKQAIENGLAAALSTLPSLIRFSKWGNYLKARIKHAS